jgi:hypothetical protein
MLLKLMFMNEPLQIVYYGMFAVSKALFGYPHGLLELS